MKIVADDKIPFLKGALEPYAEVVYLPGKQIDRQILIGADALLIRTRTKCDKALLEGTGIKIIGTATIGFDHIDIQYCSINHIPWSNAPGCNSSSVQQYIASALFRVSKRFGFELKDKTLGIIGVGNVGSKVEKFAGIIGMKVLLNDPPRSRKEDNGNFYSLDVVLSHSDIVTVHVPLNIEGEDQTYHLFDEERFKQMKKGAILINTSRGEVIDTIAFRRALAAGKPGGAVLDVWENEPDADLELLHQSFIATPHIAGYSADGKANGTAMVVNSLSRFFNLPLENWYPENVPAADSPYIEIDCTGRSGEAVMQEAVIHTYAIEKDDAGFRNSPSDFEKLRGDYPLRREFTSYTVRLKNGYESIRARLQKLGFSVEI